MTVQQLTNGNPDGALLGRSDDKIGAFGATPVVQQVAATDLGTVLSNLGLRVAGTAYPITTSGAVALTGTLSVTDITVTNDVTIGDAGNIILKTTTGSQLGTAVTQKLGLFGVTPVVQPAAAAQAVVATSVTTTITTTNLDATVTDLITLANALRTAGINLGVWKGAA